MSSLKRSTQVSLLMGFFFAAAVGFSYALATSSGTDEAYAAGVRAVGSNPRLPLAFTDPFVNGSTDRDLGDAALGSQITRYIHARGGFPPYRFVSDRTTLGDDGKPLFIGATTLGEAEIALPVAAKGGQSTTAVFLNGLLQGKVGDKTGTIADGTPLRFDTTCADSRGTNPNRIDEIFRITLVDPNTTFKFAQTLLNSGVEFRRYYEKVEVIGGHAPYTFTASNITLTKNGTSSPIASFSDFGLFLNKNNGRLVGRPLDDGTLSFDADCVDSAGSHALSRDKSKVGQRISFNVDPNLRVSSELFTTKMSIKGDTTGGNKDSIKYSGLLDLEGSSLSDLQGLGVTLTIGNYTSPTVTLDGKGTGTSGGPPSMSVKITSDGLVSITIANDSFGAAQSIVANSQLANNNIVLAVSLTIGDTTMVAKPLFENPELLRFNVHARSSKFDLEYKFGPGNLGGGFLITSVAGKDDKAETGDAWLVKFISLPPDAKKLSQFGTVASSTVGIGTDFTNSINCSSNGSVVKSTEHRKGGPVVLKVGYSETSGQGQVQTGLLPYISNLPNTQTSIKPALNANGKKSPFPFIITFNDSTGKEIFGAEGSRQIKPKGNQWVSKDLNK
ncbi:MAG TPA: hypothetical protein VKX17_06860 [Planctomycetota bacterium]|nr:hypothetical protein [Planctomycetota bacterium]